MSAISRTLRLAEDGHGGHQLMFYCAGCKMAHGVNMGDGPGPRWIYNGNPDQPTFRPSVLVSWDQWEPSAADSEVRAKIKSGEIVQRRVARVCHSFVTDGRIQYLSDSTHHLAGQTIDLPPFRWGEDDPDDEVTSLRSTPPPPPEPPPLDTPDPSTPDPSTPEPLKDAP